MVWNEEYDRTMKKAKKMGSREIIARMETRLEKVAPKGKCIVKLAWLRPEHKRYFAREQKIAGLRHKNLAYTLAVDEAQQPKPETEDDKERSKIIVTAQEYIDSEMTPWERTQTGLAQRIDFAIQAGEGLRELHRLGLLHRDIKRSNLLITKDGTVKVIDTGLMKALDYTESSVTQNDEVVGTPAYYPPEQAGDDTVDIRADIYAVGSTLYEYLIGIAPNVMATQNPQTINAILQSRDKKVLPLMPSQTSALNELIVKFVEEEGLSPEQARELPGYFDAVFTKLLHRKKEGRYQSVPQYLTDLNALKEGERPPVAFEELGRRKLTPEKFATGAFSYHMGNYLEDETMYADAKQSQHKQLVLEEGGFVRRHWKKFGVGLLLLGAVATPLAIAYQDTIKQVIDFITGK
jgi:serine/threonine protein kinase